MVRDFSDLVQNYLIRSAFRISGPNLFGRVYNLLFWSKLLWSILWSDIFILNSIVRSVVRRFGPVSGLFRDCYNRHFRTVCIFQNEFLDQNRIGPKIKIALKKWYHISAKSHFDWSIWILSIWVARSVWYR